MVIVVAEVISIFVLGIVHVHLKNLGMITGYVSLVQMVKYGTTVLRDVDVRWVEISSTMEAVILAGGPFTTMGNVAPALKGVLIPLLINVVPPTRRTILIQENARCYLQT